MDPSEKMGLLEILAENPQSFLQVPTNVEFVIVDIDETGSGFVIPLRRKVGTGGSPCVRKHKLLRLLKQGFVYQVQPY
jgi:hypothetical protein